MALELAGEVCLGVVLGRHGPRSERRAEAVGSRDGLYYIGGGELNTHAHYGGDRPDSFGVSGSGVVGCLDFLGRDPWIARNEFGGFAHENRPAFVMMPEPAEMGA